MDKSKFTRDPQLDSEGFVMRDARCHGCAPDEMCPRSGHCERYNSPLREMAERLDAFLPIPGCSLVGKFDALRAADGNSFRYHATGLPAGGDRRPGGKVSTFSSVTPELHDWKKVVR